MSNIGVGAYLQDWSDVTGVRVRMKASFQSTNVSGGQEEQRLGRNEQDTPSSPYPMPFPVA